MKFGEVQFPVQHFDEANGAMMKIFVDNNIAKFIIFGHCILLCQLA